MLPQSLTSILSLGVSEVFSLQKRTLAGDKFIHEMITEAEITPFVVVVNIRYNVMYANDVNPHLIDVKMYLFLVEYHVRDTSTDLAVH